MLSNRRGTTLCLVSLLVGILVGGAIEAANHRNYIHLTVMPWGDVNVSPEVGDMIDWTPYGQKTLTIKFDQDSSTLCDLTSNNICRVKPSVGPGVYLYECTGTANCPDPGVGPGSSTGAVRSIQLLLQLFDRIVVRIARFFGFSPIEDHRAKVAALHLGAETAAGAPAATGAAAVGAIASQGLQALSSRAMVYGVKCDNSSGSNVTVAPPVTGSLNKTIYWTSPEPFTLTMNGAVCQEAGISTPSIAQQCTLQSAGASPTYTATESSCSATPSAAQPITIQ